MDVNLTSEAKVKLDPGITLSFTYQVFTLVKYLTVSGFECTVPLFRTRRYKVVSPTYATRIGTCGQSSSFACFDQHSDEKPKVEMKAKSNCAPDGSVMLANGFSE